MTPPRIAPCSEHGYALAELLVAIAMLGLVMAGVLSVYLSGNTLALSGQNKADAQQGARATLQIEEDLRLAGYGYPPAIAAPPTTAFVAATATSITFWADLTNVSTTLTCPPGNPACTTAVAAGGTTLTVTSGSGFAAGDTLYLINDLITPSPPWQTLNVASATATTITTTTGALAAYPPGSQVGRPRQITFSWNAGLNTLLRNAGDGTGNQTAATGVTVFQLDYYDNAPTNPPGGNPIALPPNLANIRRVRIRMTVNRRAGPGPDSRFDGEFKMDSSVRPRNL
jgi:Tfp pilus assembly protein PilW